jgi:hypothetical protein
MSYMLLAFLRSQQVCTAVCPLSLRIQDSLLGLVTRVRDGRPRDLSVPGRGKRFFSHVSRPDLGPIRPLESVTGGSFQGVKRLGRESDHIQTGLGNSRRCRNEYLL